MEENKTVSEAISEIKNSDEESLKKVIEDWFERTRTDGLKIGARFIAAAVIDKIQRHLDKPGKASLRDYERCIADIKRILVVQLTEQDDSTKNSTSEEKSDD
jgi:uncharacterized protein YutE (UPF0331/DUF86 family)